MFEFWNKLWNMLKAPEPLDCVAKANLCIESLKKTLPQDHELYYGRGMMLDDNGDPMQDEKTCKIVFHRQAAVKMPSGRLQFYDWVNGKAVAASKQKNWQMQERMVSVKRA